MCMASVTLSPNVVGSVTYSTDLENEVNKIFIISQRLIERKNFQI